MISPNTPNLSYGRLSARRKRPPPDPAVPERRIAILSDAASQQFVPVLRTLFEENQVNATIYEAGFDAIELEAINPHSGLYEFTPDVIVLALCTQALRLRYFHHSAGDFAARSLHRVQQIWSALRANTRAQILQFNYAMPYERLFGNFDLQAPHSLYASVGRLNATLAQAASAESSITIIDVEAISSEVGRKQWFDDRLWFYSKAFCNLEYLPLVCQSVVSVTLTLLGRIRKCLVLDLDNTLWGGVVGDLGHLGIQIGPHGDGEPFFHFQSYLLALKRRGIILAVCSKNDLENALRPFNENPDMVLRRSDIAVFVANWDNKADNLRTIRERLNIGLDSMVFLDDSPFERNLVRQMLPEVVVPEMPEDPAEYVSYLASLNLFEATAYSPEDARRADQYKEEADRQQLQATASDVGEYLKSLDMTIHVARFDPENIPRIAQLTQRSNQFNLTTQRLNEDECREMMLETQRWTPLYAKLADRFGDHGLISVVTLRHIENIVFIANWLMSCRVLARGVEECMLAEVVRRALARGAERIEAEYIPSAKNAMVKTFYARMGFAQLSNEHGRTRWTLDPKAFQPAATCITQI